MAHGSILDDFSKMQIYEPVIENTTGMASWCDSPRKPWCGHPGTPNACQSMKHFLSLLLPDFSVSEIDDLNTYLLTRAGSKEDYENLNTLEARVLLSPFKFSEPIVDHPCNCSSIGVSKMQMDQPVIENPIGMISWCDPPRKRKPWCGHPGTHNACQSMKYFLSLLLPDFSVSEIDDLNTYLLTRAGSKADYENLYTLEARVLLSPFKFSGPIVDHLCNCSSIDKGNLSPNYELASGRPELTTQLKEQKPNDFGRS